MKVVINDGGRKAAGYMGATGDCVTRSIAIVAQLPYQEVYDRLARIMATMPKTKKRKKAGINSAADGVYTKSKLFKDYMKELGFVWTPTMQIGSGCKVHLATGELPKGRLVVAVSKHYTSVIDGVIHDTHDPQRADSFMFERDVGQTLKANQGRNVNGVWTKIGGRCVYGYWQIP
jgi:hypothetical protein